MSATEVTPNLLIIDDDESIRNLLTLAAKNRSWRPVAAASGSEGCHQLDSHIKAVILDHGLPDGTGIQALGRLRDKYPDVPVIMLTGLNDAETAVRALKAGADDYLTKPIELERLFSVIRQAIRLRGQPPQAQAAGPTPKFGKSESTTLTSRSPRMLALLKQMAKAAQLNITVLLTGESGTGKTLIAREIHRLSTRSAEPFIPVSCPALPRELLESELFGHERGAFTGATASRVGRFEQATKGTIFLDEIGDLPGELQPKLLTVLQDQEFFRVGGNRMLRTEARIIAATNIDLQARVEQGHFREDLYYRLNVLELHLPPLRERIEDLPAFLRSMLDQIARERGTVPWTVTRAAIQMLAAHHWPGNLRQLANVLERATAFADGTQLDEPNFAPLLQTHRGPSAAEANPILSLQEVERHAFLEAYQRSGLNKARTARELGIAERTVYNLLARYKLK